MTPDENPKSLQHPPASVTTSVEYADRILRVQQYIQEHLNAPTTLETLASIAHFSPFHFHRIFKGIVGETVAKYTQRLRLERSAGQLIRSERSISVIANESGYGALESFSRAFKSHFGVGPREYRKSQKDPHFDSPVAVVNEQTSSNRLEAVCEIVGPLAIAYVRHVGPYDEVGSAFQTLVQWAMQHRMMGPSMQFLGVSYDDPAITSPEQVRFDAAMSVPSNASGQAGGGVAMRDVAPMWCACAVHRGPYSELDTTYCELLGRWFPERGYLPALEPCMEFYLNDPTTVSERDLLTRICVPISNLENVHDA